MPRTSKSVRTALLPSLVLLFAAAIPGLAMATTSSSGGSLPFLETLCDGDCGDIAVIDARRANAGFDDDFSLGLQLVRDGLDLTLKSDGNILLFGPLAASGTVELITEGAVVINSGSQPGTGGGTDIVFGGGDVTLGAGFRVGDLAFRPLAGAGATMISRTNEELALFLRDVGVVSAVTGVDAIFPKSEPSSDVVVYREGDIYIDVSLFELQNLKVIAGKSIVFVSSDSAPVPEPGTALLFGLGLTMLTLRRS